MAGDSTAANIFGGALKRHRQSLAWSQEDLAEASGVAARTISDLERGVAQQPRSATVRMLAEALGLSGAALAAFKAAARASREAELDRPADAASSSRGSGCGVGTYAVVVGIFAVEEMCGIGETALALRAAHMVADQLLDGQLFINLQWHTPGVRPVAPESALHSLLSALGVTHQQIPESLRPG